MGKTVKEVIVDAVQDRDANLAGKVAAVLRDQGLNYQESYEFVNSISPISARN